jgi:hypothetical protein
MHPLRGKKRPRGGRIWGEAPVSDDGIGERPEAGERNAVREPPLEGEDELDSEIETEQTDRGDGRPQSGRIDFNRQEHGISRFTAWWSG